MGGCLGRLQHEARILSAVLLCVPTRTGTHPTAHRPCHPRRAGIAVRQSFNHNATATLLTQGILDSICAGVLIYVGLSGPMNATKASAGWLRQQGHLVHVACFAALAGGAASMAVIGKWA